MTGELMTRRRIWLVTVGEPLPVDPDPRLFRCGLLAEELTRRGHDVIWWTSSFDHSNKVRRAQRAVQVPVGGRSYLLRLLPSLGYQTNMGARRLADHCRVAVAYLAQTRHLDPPDVVVTSLPTLELCAANAWRGWNQLVDVRDLWPDIFDRALPERVRPLPGIFDDVDHVAEIDDI